MGLLMASISESELRSGLSPPCMQMILSSMTAHTGIALKTSRKYFQILRLYLRLPELGGLTLIVEAVYAVYAGILVIAPKQKEVLGELQLVA